jgi:hypothetical protein
MAKNKNNTTNQRGTHSLLSPSGQDQQASAGIPGRRARAPMNAIRAIHPVRHEALWVLDEGQRAAGSGQLSAEARRAGRRLPGVLPHGPA